MLEIDLTPHLRPRSAFSLPALEWAGCLLGLAGAVLLALRTPASAYGFALFLASNICWIAVAVRRRSTALLLMQLGFTATSAFGLWN